MQCLEARNLIHSAELKAMKRTTLQWGGHSAPRLASPLQPYLCYVPGDLQQELAYLKAHVFPHLDSLCQARGTCFRPVDIQRTLNEDGDDEGSGHKLQTPQAGSTAYHQQLKISLDLINSSTSFFCLLGQHYGSFLPKGPSESLDHVELEQNLHGAARGGYPWVMEDKHRSCSLTELEITQAVFRGEPKRCFFYFRDCTPRGEEGSQEAVFQIGLSSAREHERQRLWELKSRIINTCLPVRFFKNLQELEELVRKDWTGIIDHTHPVPEECSISGYQDSLELWYHESHIQALCHAFVPSTQTTEVLGLLDAFASQSEPRSDDSGLRLLRYVSVTESLFLPLFSDTDKRDLEKSILLISGERGSGKSSLAAWWLQNFRKRNPRVPVIPYFCGTSTSSRDIRSVLRQCTAELRKVFYGNLPEWADGLEGCIEPRPLLAEMEAFTAAAQLGPCVVLLDGLDLLTDALGLSLQEAIFSSSSFKLPFSASLFVKELRWLPVALPSHCKLIVTTTTTDLTYKSLSSRSDVQVFTWPGISDPCVQHGIFRRHLALPCKELPALLLQRIMGRKLCRLPVFLAVVGGELRTCGMEREEEEEYELIEEYMEVDSVSELWAKVIRRWVKDYGGPAEDSLSSSKRLDTSTASRPASSSPALELRGWVWDTLCLIHISRAGLTQDEVLALLEDMGHCSSLRIQALEWARLRSAFGPWVQEKPNGLLCFSHQSVSQTMELLLLGVVDQQNSRSYFHRVLAKFFQRPCKTPGGWLRMLEELPWHLAQTGSFEELHRVLTHSEAMDFLSTSARQYPQLRLDLARYWTMLSHRGYDPVSSLQRLLQQNDPPVGEDEELFITEVQTHTVAGRGLPDLRKLSLFFFDILLCLGKTTEAENMLSQAALQQADGNRGRLLLEVHHMLAKFYIHMQQLEEAEMYCSRGLETAASLTASGSVREEDVRMIKGQLLCFQCQLELERGRLHSVPGILKEISRTGLMSVHPCAGATLSVLEGLYKRSVGELSAAESCLQAALVSRRCWYGSEHPLVAAVEEQLADIRTEGIHPDKDWTQRKAAELYRHAIHVREAVTQRWGMTFDLSKPILQDLTNTLLKLGKVLMQSTSKAEKREALSLLQRAADLSHLLNPGDPPPTDLECAINADIAGDEKTLSRAAPGSTPTSTAGQLSEFPTSPESQLPGESNRGTLISTHSGSERAAQQPKHYPDRTLTRPWSSFQTTVFGPQSDIRSLVPRAGLCGPRKIWSRESSATRPLPARCPIQEEAVKALTRQMGTPVHKR
ncbi:hypothetical protein NFI96_013088 [Prochilodus magdalenae]|nr:hypothetical protein NFI96_013088 [Prochilodus magdalenae]